MIDSSASSEIEDADYDFDNIINFRDVGKTVNTFLGKKVLKEGLLFRSAKLDGASPRDRLRLTEVYGIKSVIDLRSKTEHLNAEEKHKLLPNPLPLQIPSLTYNRIILPSRRFELFLLWQLSWLNILKFLLLYLTNHHAPAISLISHHALGPRGLTNLALDTLTHSPHQISLSLSLLITPSPPQPTIIHCTQGKDRTGLLIILILLLLSTPHPAIEHDYHLTSTTSTHNIRLSEVREIGLPDAFADTHPEMVRGVIAWLDKNYGGVDGYLDEINFGHLQRQRLREVLGYSGQRGDDEKPKMSRSMESSIKMLDSPSETSIQMEKSETSI